jgi:hypothetical protein
VRVFAVLVGVISATCFAVACWLLALTGRFYFSDQYAPGKTVSFSYSIGNVEADGSGIFFPVFLIVIVGIFFAKFAFNLWRDAKKGKRLVN